MNVYTNSLCHITLIYFVKRPHQVRSHIYLNRCQRKYISLKGEANLVINEIMANYDMSQFRNENTKAYRRQYAMFCV